MNVLRLLMSAERKQKDQYQSIMKKRTDRDQEHLDQAELVLQKVESCPCKKALYSINRLFWWFSQSSCYVCLLQIDISDLACLQSILRLKQLDEERAFANQSEKSAELKKTISGTRANASGMQESMHECEVAIDVWLGKIRHLRERCKESDSRKVNRVISPQLAASVTVQHSKRWFCCYCRQS